MGAYLNVRINASQLEGDARAAELVERGAELQRRAQELEAEILGIVDGRM
jgi:formiminotetrahydrofolate cyclodeaminase